MVGFPSFGDRRSWFICLHIPRLYLHDHHLSFSEQGIPWNNQRSFTNDCVHHPYDYPNSGGVPVFVLSRMSSAPQSSWHLAFPVNEETCKGSRIDI